MSYLRNLAQRAAALTAPISARAASVMQAPMPLVPGAISPRNLLPPQAAEVVNLPPLDAAPPRLAEGLTSERPFALPPILLPQPPISFTESQPLRPEVSETRPAASLSEIAPSEAEHPPGTRSEPVNTPPTRLIPGEAEQRFAVRPHTTLVSPRSAEQIDVPSAPLRRPTDPMVAESPLVLQPPSVPAERTAPGAAERPPVLQPRAEPSPNTLTERPIPIEVERPPVLQPRAELPPNTLAERPIPIEVERPPVLQPRVELPPNALAERLVPPERPPLAEPPPAVMLQPPEARHEPIQTPQPGRLVERPIERPLWTVSAIPRPPTESTQAVEVPRPIVRRSVEVRIGSVELRVQRPPTEPPSQVAPPPLRPPAPGLGEYAARRSYRGDDL